ncbi:MAG: hypothetical protein N4A63_13385 [Vallitalea sp.]|jgi:hypothetical protein|nr:hypothetical protein [Vallitalea sp.]
MGNLDEERIFVDKAERKREYEEEQTYLICALRCYMYKIEKEEPFSDEFESILIEVNDIKYRLKLVNNKLKQIRKEINNLFIREKK